MEEFFLEKTQNFGIFPRRFGLKPGKTHLFGCAKSGKTSLALDFAKTFKHPIYIDCKDPRVDIDNVKSTLLKYYLEKKVDILIVDNFCPDFTLPKLENIVLITDSKIEAIPKDFFSKPIYPLSFEEYISFDKKNLSINALFNHFLKDGNLPEMQYLNEYQKILRKQEINALAFGQNIHFFRNIIPYQSKKITTNQLYTQLKKYFKISKDTIYGLIEQFQSNGSIYLLPHINDAKKPKKIYFYDFSLPYAFCAEKFFQAIFENMVFLELFYKCDKLYYDENCDFLDDKNQAFFCLPFPNPKMIQNKLSRIKKDYSKITILTINYDIEGKINNTPYEATSFMNFTLGE